MKKVLILYGFEHSGHHAAALALREAFIQNDPGLSVDLLNLFVYSSRLIEKIATGIFYRIVKSTPSVWDGIYRNPRSEPRFDRFRRVVRTFALRGVGDALREYEPDAVVCTQSFPCGMMHDYKNRLRSDIPLYGVLTDFFAPPYWIYPRVDRYFVACAAARDKLSRQGIDAAAITESGIPIRPCFALRTSRREARAAFGLDPDAATILVVGGWSGWGDLQRLAVETGVRGGECRVVVVTGRNRRLYDTLRGQADIERHRITVLPVVERMDILMRAADLLVGKAGGMTSSEALATGLPMVLVDSLPGQERANATYLCRHGAAVQARGVEDAGQRAVEIALDAGRLQEMGHRARALAKPDAASEIARGVIEGTNAIPSPDGNR
ncbi:MAG: glycosyltransferase [Chlamydiota bacterium]